MKISNGIWAIGAAALLAGLTGCGTQGGQSGSPGTSASGAPAIQESTGAATPAADARVTITDFTYSVPGTIKPGQTVTVVNEDSAPHTLTAKDKGGFDVEVAGGATLTFTAPKEPGEYGIICTFHPQMNGTLVVK